MRIHVGRHLSRGAVLLAAFLAAGPLHGQATGPSPQGTPTGAAAQATPAAAQTGPPAQPAPAKPPGPDLSVPLDTETSWTVGFTAFKAENLSPENAYLASSVPLLVRDQVSGLTRHSIDPEEQDAVRRSVLARARAAADQAVTAARGQHDALFFSGTAQNDAAQKAAADSLRFALAREDFLASLDLSQITVAADKPVSIAAGPGEGRLLDAPSIPPAAFCARNGLDLLVGGTVSEVQGYLLVQIWAWHAARGAYVISARAAALREELYGELPAVETELTTAILGRQWAVVAFAPRPPESSLYVDGKLVASGASPALYLDPGNREIRISAPGYEEVSRAISLEPGASLQLEDELTLTQPGSVEVTTDPPGATLYVDSRWEGVTPVTVDRPAQRSRGVLDLGGYYPVEVELGPSSAGSVSVTLPRDTGPRSAAQEKARDDFYAAFGWFAASIPIPLLSYALVFDFAVESTDFYRAGMLPEAAQAQSSSQTFLVGYYSGIALSGALFAWMVVRIIQYVAAANASG